MTVTREQAEGHTLFQPKDWLDRFFMVGIILKGLNGVVELVAGVLLFFVTPVMVQHAAIWVVQSEWVGSPEGFLASRVLKSAGEITGNGVVFGAVYLLLHGIVKVVLVVALLLNQLWAYPCMIAVLIAFIVYQVYRIVVAQGIAMILLTVFDLLIVWLTWREYGKQRLRRSPS